MIGLLCFVLAVLASSFKSKLRLQAENAVLRHQLIVVRRRLPGRVRLTNHDRWFLIQLYRWFPSILQVLTSTAVFKVVGTHRSISDNAYYCKKTDSIVSAGETNPTTDARCGLAP